MRFNSNVLAFWSKRTCVSNKTHLRLNLNALTFLEALFFICFTRLICLGILRRQYAELLLKALGKIAGRAESYPVGHFRHVQFSVLKKLRSPLQTNGTDKFRRSLSGNSLQLSVRFIRLIPISVLNCSTLYSELSICSSINFRAFWSNCSSIEVIVMRLGLTRSVLRNSFFRPSCCSISCLIRTSSTSKLKGLDI